MFRGVGIERLFAVLLSQATTWQWVAFECLIPRSSAVSGGRVLQSVLVMLLPGELLLLLLVVGSSW
jgi:hypothetical protein